jgi:hypothetical protein
MGNKASKAEVKSAQPQKSVHELDAASERKYEKLDFIERLDQ